MLQDLRVGDGPTPKLGDTVVVLLPFLRNVIPFDALIFLFIELPYLIHENQVDWDGYTIGYYGRIFEARNKTKGGSFEVHNKCHIFIPKLQLLLEEKIMERQKLQGNDKDFFKFKVGSQEVIPAFEEAISGMTPGSVRRFCFSFL